MESPVYDKEEFGFYLWGGGSEILMIFIVFLFQKEHSGETCEG